ncbi:hypothetical protein, partial [Marinobacter aromaticivorans]
IRIDEIHLALLEAIVEKFKEQGIKANKTNVIEKAIYSFASDYALEDQTIKEIIDKHYKGFEV